jgi:hypothetical protein
LDYSVTPPAARKRTAGGHAAGGSVAAGVRRSIGADRLAQAPGQRVLPIGVTHVVDGWDPLCGGPRVRFVFPGCSLDDAPEVCDACAGPATRRVPRQRRTASG